MSFFYYIYVETIGKWKNVIFFFKCEKMYKSTWWVSVTENEKIKNVFFFFKSEKNVEVQLMSFSYIHADRRTYIYAPVDKRYSPIISTIWGPNKAKNWKWGSPSMTRYRKSMYVLILHKSKHT